MDANTQIYRGFTISVTPLKGHDDLWDFEYGLCRSGQPAAPFPAKRSHTLGGHANADIARMAGMEVAKTEVDNLLALEQT